MKMFILTSLLLSMSLHVFAKDEVNPYALFLQGSGLEAEIVYFTEPNKSGLYDALIKFYGMEAYNLGIDKKVIRYEAVRSGRGIDYQTKVNGKAVTRLTLSDDSTDNGYYEAYMGKKMRLTADYKESKSIQPLHIYTEYKTKK